MSKSVINFQWWNNNQSTQVQETFTTTWWMVLTIHKNNKEIMTTFHHITPITPANCMTTVKLLRYKVHWTDFLLRRKTESLIKSVISIKWHWTMACHQPIFSISWRTSNPHQLPILSWRQKPIMIMVWLINTLMTLTQMNCTNSITKTTLQNLLTKQTHKKTSMSLLINWRSLQPLTLLIHPKRSNITSIININKDKMMLVILIMRLNVFKSVEMTGHMLRSTIRLEPISLLLTNMLLTTNIKLKSQSVLSKMTSNWEITYKHNSQETTLMMLNTLKLPKTQSTTLLMPITAQCNKKVKNNIKLSMILKF